MARIATSVHADHCAEEDCDGFGVLRSGKPTQMMADSLVWHLTADNFDHDRLDRYFREVYVSPRGKVRIVQVVSASEESKRWAADPSNRLCDAPGSWYCPGRCAPLPSSSQPPPHNSKPSGVNFRVFDYPTQCYPFRLGTPLSCWPSSTSKAADSSLSRAMAAGGVKAKLLPTSRKKLRGSKSHTESVFWRKRARSRNQTDPICRQGATANHAVAALSQPQFYVAHIAADKARPSPLPSMSVPVRLVSTTFRALWSAPRCQTRLAYRTAAIEHRARRVARHSHTSAHSF